jgi:putative membrane protein
MKNIATRNNTTIDLQQYITKEFFDETGRQEIWLHNLPNTSFLFDIINKLREKYKNETFVISQNIDITNKIINKEILFFKCIFLEKIAFSNCEFKKKVKFEKSEIKRGISIEKSSFYKAVFLLESIFKFIEKDPIKKIGKQGAVFNDTIFKDYTKCEKTLFNEVFLENVHFEKESSFLQCKFYNVTFNKTYFSDVLFAREFSENSEMKNVFFQNTIFKGYAYFEMLFKGDTNFLNCMFNPITTDKKVEFLESIFEGKTYFTGSKFNTCTDFSHLDYDFQELEACHFKDNADFSDCIFSRETNFSKVIFEGDTNFSETIFGQKDDTSSYEVSFNDAKFNKVARFHSCNFYSDTKFENTSFYTLVDFYLSVFHKEQQFLRTDFLDIAIFSNTTFKGETQFLYNKIESNSYINFESAKFEKGLDISRANFNCNLNFWNIFIQDDKIFEFTNYTDDFGEHKEEAVPSVYKQLRETYRIIKSNFYSQNNKIEGLKFYEKEMSVYLEEKREETNEKKTPKNKKTFIEKFREKFMEEPILSVGQLLILFFTILWTILKCPIFYIASAIFTSLIISGIIIKNKESLKYRNPIKQNYYMPIILLFIAIILLYFYIYNIHNIKNPFYIIVTYIMLFFSMLLFYFPLEKDKIILWLNKNSNEFDTNWVVGVNFSMLVGCLTYFTILLSINSNIVFDESPKGISNFLTSLVDVFNITKWDNLEIIGVKLKDLSYLLLFIGRIFIGYGYYQTIQAFRKFGKS